MAAASNGAFVNGFNYEWTVNVDPPYTVSTDGTMEGCTKAEVESCSVTPATWDNKDTITVNANIPADLTFPDNMTPSFIEFKMCFSPPSTVNRKWRKINDLFKVCSSVPHTLHQ